MADHDKPTGPAAAAVLSAGFGVLALAFSHILDDYSEAGRKWVHAWGKAWMPGAEGIGPYSGKETLALVAWLGSWLLLHMLFRRKNVRLSDVGVIFIALIGIATTLLWPPVTEQVLRLLHGGH